ncbi:MAG: prephenate dehydrogenase/arogenate dehydrogenase family protein [Thermodesulfobacteriota bacterium]
MEPEFIGVVGSQGRMGAWLVRLLSQAGLRVRAADLKAGPVNWSWLAECPVVFLAVPIPALAEAARNLGPHTREDGVVMDLCSVKEAPVRYMLEHCRGEVAGCHPLFGPAAAEMKDRLVFVCPGRGRRWLDWWTGFLKVRGARVVEIMPARHDWLMARVQVLRQLALFSFGLSLARLNFDAREDLPLAGPWFSSLLEILGAQLRQTPELYADLALSNPEARPVMEEFARSAGQVSRLVAAGDREALVECLAEVARRFPHLAGEEGGE